MEKLMRKGFSLAELGIALVILIVISTIGIISYFFVIDNSREVKVIEDANAIRLALTREHVNINDYSIDYDYGKLDLKVKEVLEYHLDKGTNLTGVVFPNKVVSNKDYYTLGEIKVKKSEIDNNTALLDLLNVDKVKADNLSGSLSIRKIDNNKMNSLLQDNLKGDWFIISSLSSNSLSSLIEKCLECYQAGYAKGYHDGINNLEYDDSGKVENNENNSGSNLELITKVVPKKPDEIPVGFTPIYSIKDLDKIRGDLSGKFILMNNIDLSSVDNFEPIGYQIKDAFRGTFDGNGYRIIGLKINLPDSDSVGLFASTYRATIKNLILEDVDIEGNRDIGGLVGSAKGLNNSYKNYISNVSVSGNVKGNSINVGGLVGIGIDFSSIETSSFEGNVEADRNVGGLLGNLTGSSTVERSFTEGIVKGSSYVGGLIGSVSDSSIISNSYSIVDISGVGYVGGLVSYLVNSTINTSYSVGNVEWTGNAGTVGGLLGWNTNSKVDSNSYWDIDVSRLTRSAGGTGKITSEMKSISNYKNWDFDTIWTIDEGSDYPRFR